jgi:large subunit ribosomal protein L17
MRHRARSRKLGRTSAHRAAMYRNMVTSLLQHGRIETTDAKAKEVRRIADRMITLGKRGTLHARRRALRVIRQREVAARVFDELADRYRDRPGGYTRVLKLRHRVGDAAPMSMVELVEGQAPVAARAAGRKKRSKKIARKTEEKTGKAAAEEGGDKPARKKSGGKKATAKASEATAKKASKKTSKKTSKKASGTKKKTARKKTSD